MLYILQQPRIDQSPKNKANLNSLITYLSQGSERIRERKGTFKPTIYQIFFYCITLRNHMFIKRRFFWVIQTKEQPKSNKGIHIFKKQFAFYLPKHIIYRKQSKQLASLYIQVNLSKDVFFGYFYLNFSKTTLKKYNPYLRRKQFYIIAIVIFFYALYSKQVFHSCIQQRTTKNWYSKNYSLFVCEVQKAKAPHLIIYHFIEVGDSFVTFENLAADSQLIKLFANSDHNPSRDFQVLANNQTCQLNRFEHLSIKQADIEKGYASDESPQKKMKSKKVRKRKAFIPPRNKQHKDRATTKFYIDSLQSRVQQLEIQVQKLRSLNKLNLEYIRKINDSQLIINGFFQHRQKIIEKLQKLTSQEKPDLRLIKSECISLKKKQGCYGTDRIKAVQYYFKQLVDMICTNSHKYLAETAFKNSDLFNPASIDTWEEWRKEMFEKLDLSPEILAHMSGKRNQIIILHNKFNEKLLEMYGNKCSLLHISRQIEGLYQKLNNQLTPMQTGRLMCFLQKYKFQSDFYVQEPVRKMYEQLSDHTRFSYESKTLMID